VLQCWHVQCGSERVLGAFISARRLPAKVAAAICLMSPAWDLRTDMLVLHAKLIVTGSTAGHREIPLFEFPTRLGRSPAADICVDDRWVSRDHCEIDCENQSLVVRDLGSKHGTYVNGRPVTYVQLHSGDELSVGLSRFLVELVNDSDSAEVVQKAYA
jgi:pSer/pThr/pTyr-binding forkhead associated (FHA) protein